MNAMNYKVRRYIVHNNIVKERSCRPWSPNLRFSGWILKKQTEHSHGWFAKYITGSKEQMSYRGHKVGTDIILLQYEEHL